ncbi:hypothetical protein, partial [Phormidium sp. CCY1219]|uniref:hypothetical protein n=1 Tax=Phormidium sp. CCY1219 TaxID=2886104 RepID=UPI002D1E5D3D
TIKGNTPHLLNIFLHCGEIQLLHLASTDFQSFAIAFLSIKKRPLGKRALPLGCIYWNYSSTIRGNTPHLLNLTLHLGGNTVGF